MLEEIIRESADFLVLKREFNKGTLATSILLSSKDDLYLLQFCKCVACLLFDGDNKTINTDKVLLDSHPDVKVYPAKEKLLVADSQDIVYESFIKPIFADKKVFIVKHLDEAGDAAQNKLLKILEEPPKNVYFLLTCANFERVLPTIRSRCLKIELARLEQQQIEQLLPDVDEKSLALQIADGLVGRAISLCKNKQLGKLCQECANVFTRMKASKEVLQQSKQLALFKDDYSLMLEVMSIVVSDLLKVKANQTQLVRLKQFEDDYKRVAPDYTVRALCEIALLVDEVAKDKMYNVNQLLSLENFLLKILEVKYLCK